MNTASVAVCPFAKFHTRPQREERSGAPGKTAPGPSGLPVMGVLPFLSGGRLAKITALAREYGDVVQYRAFSLPFCLLNHPDYVEDVLVNHHDKFIKGPGVQSNSLYFGRGLLTNEGKSWRHQRHTVQPAFSQRNIQRFPPVIVERTKTMLGGWRQGETIDIFSRFAVLSLDIVTRVLFDIEAGAEIKPIANAVRALQMRNACGQVLLWALKYLPTPRNLWYVFTIRRLEKTVYRLIRERRAAGPQGDDVLSILSQARDEHGNPMSERQIRDEMMTMIVAAASTTALTLSYACNLMGQHPDVGAKLDCELQRVLDGRPVRSEDLPNLPYLEGVIKETMRLYPPVPVLNREPVEDIEIGGYRIRKGTSVLICPWILHRDPRYFDSPEEFRPERWTREFQKQLPRFAFFPFSGGTRKCVGAGLGSMNVALILATVIQSIGLRPAPGFRLDPVACIDLQPRTGVKMTLGPRFSEGAGGPSFNAPSH
jgi:cytochrome P450